MTVPFWKHPTVQFFPGFQLEESRSFCSYLLGTIFDLADLMWWPVWVFPFNLGSEAI